MAGIPEDFVEQVRERADIVEVIGHHVTLRRSGASYVGLCPFHGEKTASFSVHPGRQVFHCFGCGVSGDVFTFRMRHDGLDFPEAVRALAREVGLELPDTARGEERGVVAAVHRANDAALVYFRESLRGPGGAAAREYLQARGVPAELIERFQIGFAPDDWEGLVRRSRKGAIELGSAERAGLVKRREGSDGHYDCFRGRVIFPIVEPSGHVVGFGGRALGDAQPKYLNSAESPVYRKGRLLYGLRQALDGIRARSRAVLVEGYFDVIALHRAGLHEAVATCGTALTAEHAKLLRRYTREAVLLFDGDAAGRAAAEKALPLLLAERMRVRAAFLPAGEDPDTLVAGAGGAALCALVENAVPLVEHLVETRLLGRGDSAWSASDAAESVVPILSAVVDPVERSVWVRTVAGRLRIEPGALEELLAGDARSRPPLPEPAAAPAVRRVALEPETRELIAALGAHPEQVLPELARLDRDWLLPGDGRTILESLLDAVAAQGSAAVARLVSDSCEELAPELRAELARIVTRGGADDPEISLQAARDCVDQLEIHMLEQRSRRLTSRLESCTDATEEEALLEEKQRDLVRRCALETRRRQV